MITHELIQGSDAWHQYRAEHFNASDAPAMLGCSPYETRNQLLHRLATGIKPEVDAGTQTRFNDGHRFEALARQLAEKIIGDELYPVTGSEGKLSASFDGLTMDEITNFEHKTLNDELRACMNDEGNGYSLPLQYQVQMEQQLMVSGAEHCLFMASKWQVDTLVEERHCWYKPDSALRAKIIAGWAQFEKDLAAYIPTEAVVPAAAKTVSSLPVVFDMRTEGKLVSCNLEQYKPAALAYIAAINTELVTDQNFADADADAKFCRDSAKKLELAIEQALGQMGDINQALGAVREIAAAFNAKGLALEKSVKSEKDNRKLAIVKAGKAAMHKHESGLQERTQHHLPPTAHNFEGAAKGLKTITSIQNAVDTELARCKILANASADKIHANLKTIADAGHDFLFADIGALVQKDSEYVAMAVKNRVADHQAKEAARVEAERERIRAEEQAKAEREAREKLAREQAAIAEQERTAKAIETAQAAIDASRMQHNTSGQPDRHQTVVVEAPKPAQNIPENIPAPATQPTLKLGTIAERLGFNLTADFILSLGFKPAAKMNNATLYHEADFQRICNALVAHVNRVCAS